MYFPVSVMYIKYMYCIIFILFAISVIPTSSSADVVLEVSTNDLAIKVNSTDKFSLSLSEHVDHPITIYFNYSEGMSIDYLPDNYTIGNNTDILNYTVKAFKAGHTTVLANTRTPWIDKSSAFVRINVFQISSLNIVSSVVGWIYFICWSISFYPQIIANWRRKSVVGLNFDFLGLNLTGFIAYSVFNIGLCFNDVVKAQYHSAHPTSVIPVELNDVVFAVHAAFATVVTIGQCFIYERGNQMIAKTTVAVLALVWSTAGVFLLITALDVSKYASWLTFLLFFSYVKLGITLTKYIPQVVYNYKRKSTSGWSIGTVLLDFVGGFFSIAQMFIISYNYDDWHSVIGNFTKFGLGVTSVTFDVIFMVQHYLLYPKRKSISSENLFTDSA